MSTPRNPPFATRRRSGTRAPKAPRLARSPSSAGLYPKWPRPWPAARGGGRGHRGPAGWRCPSRGPGLPEHRSKISRGVRFHAFTHGFTEVLGAIGEHEERHREQPEEHEGVGETELGRPQRRMGVVVACLLEHDVTRPRPRWRRGERRAPRGEPRVRVANAAPTAKTASARPTPSWRRQRPRAPRAPTRRAVRAAATTVRPRAPASPARRGRRCRGGAARRGPGTRARPVPTP